MLRLAQITIGLLALSISAASAIECSKAPDRTPGPFWRYRIIDGAQCWYRSETVLAKADLAWSQPAAEQAVIDAPPLAPVLVRTIAIRPAESQIAREQPIAQGGHIISSA